MGEGEPAPAPEPTIRIFISGNSGSKEVSNHVDGVLCNPMEHCIGSLISMFHRAKLSFCFETRGSI